MSGVSRASTGKSRIRDLTDQRARYELDSSFYEEIRSRPGRMVEAFSIASSAQAFVVKAGHTIRVLQSVAPRVAELALWNAHDRREGYAAMRSRIREGIYVTRDTRLWSDVPQFRPLMTCISDTLRRNPGDPYFHRFWVPCSRATMRLRGETVESGCRSNFRTAISQFGLAETDIHDVVVLFQRSFVHADSGCVVVDARTATEPGQFIEFFAEIDLLVGVSACPTRGNALDADLDTEEPGSLGVEIRDTGISPRPFQMWTDWRETWTGRWRPPVQG
jgi:uncharacterized protein YcgI (DUF1989 family)